jgi:hypothetical protein
MLFGGAFQSPQRVGRSGDEPTAEDCCDELAPPAWREDEVSVECDAARGRVDRRDLNLFVVRDSKGQPDIERELPRRTHVEHVERNAQYAGAKNEMIARVHRARGAFHQLGPGPLREFPRVGEQVPNALGWGEKDIGRTDFHRNVSLAARGESPASHRDGRGASLARRDDREYREYLSEEQRSQRGCIARRMQPEFHHGLLVRLCQIRS